MLPTGPGCIIQSDFKSKDSNSIEHGNFEVVVPEGNKLVWYQRRWDKSGWDFVGIISTNATGPGCIIQSDFKSKDSNSIEHGNFEVVVQEGSNLLHYWHDNTTRKWSRAATISNAATGPGCIIQSDFKSPDPQRVIHGNFEVVVQEGSNLLHYWHDNTDGWSPLDPYATGHLVQVP